MLARKISVNRNVHAPPWTYEAPLVSSVYGIQVRVDDAVVLAEVGWGVWPASLGEICRRAEHGANGPADLACDQGLVGEHTDAHAEIEVSVYEIDKGIVHDEFDPQFGMLGQQSAEPQRNQKPAEGGGTADSDQAGRRRLAGSDNRLDFGQRIEDFVATSVELAPIFVRLEMRVVRLTRRVPKCSSRAEICLLTVDRATFSSLATLEKLPVSATRTKSVLPHIDPLFIPSPDQ